MGFTQMLAAGDLLIDRWRHADPYARAVLTAAIDAARMGHRSPLTPALLRSAAPDYCTDAEPAQAPTEWFESALGYATSSITGNASALLPVAAHPETMGRASGYLVADYLLHQAGRDRQDVVPPNILWKAIAEHAATVSDLRRVGDSARRLSLYQHAVTPLHAGGHHR